MLPYIIVTPCAVLEPAESWGLWDCGGAPGGGGGDLLIVVLSEDLEELVEEDGKEADNDVDPLHAEETLQTQADRQSKPKSTSLENKPMSTSLENKPKAT